VTRLEAFLHALTVMITPNPKGKRHRPARTAPAVSDDTAPFPALTRNHPYQEPTP
jgi:hypothetical protein